MVRARRKSGDDALARSPHPGRKPFLTPAQEAEVLGWLQRPPTDFGFRTDLWTAARVAGLIKEKLGVAFHPNYLREWLSKRRQSPQRPAGRPKKRDDAAAEPWVGEAYAALKKSRRGTGAPRLDRRNRSFSQSAGAADVGADRPHADDSVGRRAPAEGE
ncbi:MAG: winged helix-turn-helix domain-containing protein, partial [Planctomycetia bacterium]